MENIGKVNSLTEHHVEWVIPSFFSLSTKDCKGYTSHIFSFNGEFWYLMIYPYGQRKSDSVGYVDLYLHMKTSSPEIIQHFSFSIKNSNGQKEEETHYAHVFKEKDEGFGSSCFISRDELSRRMLELLPDAALTVVCTLKYAESTENQNAENISSHEKKRKERPVKCPECSDVVLLQNWFDHECQKERIDASEKLIHDFKAIMLNGDHSDTIVKVNKEEFRLHKTILAARNPYFDSMLKSDMKEKSTGIITIEDCKPDIFRSFIHFLYTGKVDNLSPENACDLYEAADKYQEDQLKQECLHTMLKTLSVDCFCDYFVLALRHNEKELFNKAVELFITKGKEIARTVKWQLFVKDYPIQANELFIKTLDRHVT